MPSLPAGTPNWVNPGVTPTWLFTPITGAQNTVILHNFGRNPVYVGQANVTATTGMPILPNSSPVRLTNVLTPLYAVSPVVKGAVVGTLQTAGTAGTTVVTFNGAAAVTALPPGSTFIIGSTAFTSDNEAMVVAGSTSTTVLSTSTPAAFAHGTATDLVYAATPTYGQLSVRAGVE